MHTADQRKPVLILGSPDPWLQGVPFWDVQLTWALCCDVGAGLLVLRIISELDPWRCWWFCCYRDPASVCERIIGIYMSGKNALIPGLPSEQLRLGKPVRPFARGDAGKILDSCAVDAAAHLTAQRNV